MAEREDATGDRARDAEDNQKRPRLTIRQLREAAQRETLAKELAKANHKSQDIQPKANAVSQKKKPSIFRSLFQIREPTQIALNQVAAQMIAQHGSTSATKVPNVRLEKMPEFVPKVNTKWDGLPESVKHREKKEKEKEKQKASRDSFFYTDTKSGSDDGRPHSYSRNSSSTTRSSFGAYGNSSGSQGASSRTRFYAQSVNSSGDLASQQRMDGPHFSSAFGAQPTTETLPERLSHSRHRRGSTGTDPNPGLRDELALDPPKFSATNRSEAIRPRSTKSFGADPNAPPKSSATNRSLESQTLSTDRALAWESIDWAHAARSYGTAGIRTAPLQSPSPTKSRQAPLPVTPLQSDSVESRRKMNNLSLQPVLPAGPHGLEMPAIRKKKSQTRFNDDDAFLAGEAQELILLDEGDGYDKTSLPATPEQSRQRTADSGHSRVQQDLEKRPDSSRDRLGLRASMLLTEEMTPWQNQENAQLPPPSPGIEQFAMNTKTMFHKPFGNFGK